MAFSAGWWRAGGVGGEVGALVLAVDNVAGCQPCHRSGNELWCREHRSDEQRAQHRAAHQARPAEFLHPNLQTPLGCYRA